MAVASAEVGAEAEGDPFWALTGLFWIRRMGFVHLLWSLEPKGPSCVGWHAVVES